MDAATVERLAREAGALYELLGGDESTRGGFCFEGVTQDWLSYTYPSLERFAAAVRAEALEEAAKVADAQRAHASVCAAAGLRGAKESAETCDVIAAAIRALKP